MANPARGHLDLNLPLLGIFHLCILDPHRFPLPVEEWRFDHLSHLAYLLIQKPVSREFDGNCRRLPVSTRAGLTTRRRQFVLQKVLFSAGARLDG